MIDAQSRHDYTASGFTIPMRRNSPDLSCEIDGSAAKARLPRNRKYLMGGND